MSWKGHFSSTNQLIFPFDRNIQNIIYKNQVFAKLVQVGFFNQVEPDDEQGLTGGAVRSCADAFSILQDTHKVRCPLFVFNAEGVHPTLGFG